MIINKQKFIENAKRNKAVTEGKALSVHQTLMSAFLEKLSWIRRKTIVVLYEYCVEEKLYFQSIKFYAFKDEEGKWVKKYPYKVQVFYDPKNPKKMCWKKYEQYIELEYAEK